MSLRSGLIGILILFLLSGCDFLKQLNSSNSADKHHGPAQNKPTSGSEGQDSIGYGFNGEGIEFEVLINPPDSDFWANVDFTAPEGTLTGPPDKIYRAFFVQLTDQEIEELRNGTEPMLDWKTQRWAPVVNGGFSINFDVSDDRDVAMLFGVYNEVTDDWDLIRFESGNPIYGIYPLVQSPEWIEIRDLIFELLARNNPLIALGEELEAAVEARNWILAYRLKNQLEPMLINEHAFVMEKLRHYEGRLAETSSTDENHALWTRVVNGLRAIDDEFHEAADKLDLELPH